jgi:RWP-RK domain
MRMSLPCAAESLGISTTALKKACRRLGVARWPYRRRAIQEAPTGTRHVVPPPADMWSPLRNVDATPGGDGADLSWLVPARAEEGSELWFLGIDYSTPSADVDAWFARDDGHSVIGKK